LTAAAASIGCNPITSMWFLTQGWKEQKVPPQFALADPTGKEVTVLLLATTHASVPAELAGLERQLTTHFSKALADRCKENKEKVTVVAQAKLDRYKRDHPDWAVMGPREVGKAFDATFVIDMEINRVGLYDPRGAGEFYHGQADISINVWDLRKDAEDGVAFDHEYTCDFPKGDRPVPVERFHVNKFKAAFLKRMGTDLAHMFTAFPSDDTMLGDPELGYLAN
jgi:hypothetical protein